MQDDQAPFLILTLRRTGGTSLTQFLNNCSRFPTIQHEPFNRDRIWGEFVRRPNTYRNLEKLKADVEAKLADTPNIKHCFEIIPIHITRALVAACVERGYKVFLLTRRDEIGRLISLGIARATSAWGSRTAAEIYPKIIAGEMTPPAINTDYLLVHARRDAQLLAAVLKFLRYSKLPYDWLVYEEVYGSSASLQQHAIDIAATLGLRIEPNDERLGVLAGSGGQGSRVIESYIEGTAAAREALQEALLE